MRNVTLTVWINIQTGLEKYNLPNLISLFFFWNDLWLANENRNPQMSKLISLSFSDNVVILIDIWRFNNPSLDTANTETKGKHLSEIAPVFTPLNPHRRLARLSMEKRGELDVLCDRAREHCMLVELLDRTWKYSSWLISKFVSSNAHLFPIGLIVFFARPNVPTESPGWDVVVLLVRACSVAGDWDLVCVYVFVCVREIVACSVVSMLEWVRFTMIQMLTHCFKEWMKLAVSANFIHPIRRVLLCFNLMCIFASAINSCIGAIMYAQILTQIQILTTK